MMSATPRNTSPTKEPRTPDRAGMNQSMMVEPPTHMEQSTQTPQDTTVRLNIQAPLASPSRTQVLKADPVQNGGNSRGFQQYQRQVRSQTPETQKRSSNRSEMTSPGHLAPFDWEDFEDRYEKALQEADENERQMLEEFERLVKVRRTFLE